MFDTFGSELPLAARFFIAFLVVLALIGLTAWLVRRFGSNRLGAGGARGRQPRLAVIDAASVDGRRRLVLIRRDNIEHLLMIGGPTDVVIEPNIVRAAARDIGASRDAPRELGREPPARTEATAWPLQPSNEPPPVTAPRPPYRAPGVDEPWHAPEPGGRARPADAANGAAPEFPSRRAPEPSPAPIERQEPRVNAPSDHNLAEMAQQLEAALRRAPVPEGRPPVTDPLVAPVPHAAPRTPAAEFKLRAEPKVEPKFEPKAESKVTAKVEPKIEPKLERKPEIKIEPKSEAKVEPKQEPKLHAEPSGQPAPKTGAPPLDKDLYDNLEEEMANLLGRPPGKS